MTKLIDEGAPAGGEAKTEAPPAVAVAETGKIESLDAELAGLADDLIAGEFADEETVLKEESDKVSAAPAPDSASAAVAGAVVAEVAAKAVETQPASAPAAPLKAKQVAEPTPKKDVAVPARTSEPFVLLRLAAAISAPLRNQPAYVRGMVAWIALVNAFLALCVWAWVLVFRPTEAPVPAPAEHGEKAAHAEKPVGHDAKKPPKSEGHGAPAAKKKAPAKGSHGTQAKASGGH